MNFPQSRNRRLRNSTAVRNLVEETKLHPHDFLVPLFVVEGKNKQIEIPSMPGYYKYSADLLLKEIESHLKLGVQSVLLFAEIPAGKKDTRATEAINPDGLLPHTITKIKTTFPELLVMSDVALDPFSSDGHDGLVENEKIVNDPTLEVLAEMSLVHAQSGADFIAPSDMMDGRVMAIRKKLDFNGFNETGILSYSAKYASAFYGPFRDALNSAPGFGDKKTYQMNPANKREALNEVQKDLAEGADMVMIKPAIHYLDVIAATKQLIDVPVVAYHVSGEYAMIKAAAQNGWLHEENAILEATTAIKRAGADIIASYFAKQICSNLK